MNPLCLRRFSLLALLLTAAGALPAQQPESSLYQSMNWRSIGPFRAGRVSAVAGIAGNAAVYYMGSPGGGVWKTIDGGVVWTPIFDKVPVASIGAIVVAPSNPDIIYVGTGDVSLVGAAVNIGKGVWKSVDAGRTWTHIGLDETEHFGAMWIDPKNPDIVVAAALGKTFSRNPERGIFKTIDGGKTWRKTLYKDTETGAIDVVFDATDTKVGYAALWHHLVQPGETSDLINGSKGGAIYKTTDGGDTWTPVGKAGLPPGEMSRIGIATTKGGNTVVAIVAGAGMGGGGGLYRSDDGGANWSKSTPDPRITGSGYFSRVFLDPQNSDVIYVAQTSLYRSEDGGKTFISFKGAPGGDDNHALWIDPTNSARMIMASDQGATISMDRGQSWSSWYNQPTAQVYHMSTDHRWPYWVFGTQQDSGSVATLSRGDYGAITMLDWDPVAAYEFGYIVPSPLDPNMVYAGGPGRGLVLVNRANHQVQTISPNIGRGDTEFRFAQNPPLGFAPQDGHVFYQGTQFLMQTSDAGIHWKKASPDLTERLGSAEINEAEKKAAPEPGERPARTREASETLTPPNRSAINTFSLSPVKAGTIWAGTTNGLVQLTTDGGAHWSDATPKGLSRFAMISMLEASHFDAATAYVSVDRHEESDFNAHIFVTHDLGKTWTEACTGIAPGDFVRVVREDPKQRNLLYAGTENRTYVSFNEGAHWQPLQLNMPPVSVRDLQIEGSDLVAATYGRSFWILDDVSPLRQIPAMLDAKSTSRDSFLYKPEKALRVQLDLNGDTPIPPELPAGQNPPDGALLDFYLKSAPAGEVTLSIFDSAGKPVREFSTRLEEQVKEPSPNVPDYWLGHPLPLTKTVGMNRFLWDLRYAPPQALRHQYAISAMYGGTPADPLGALVVPGTYEVRLTVNGKTFKQPLEVALDPRVQISQAALEHQFALEMKATTMTSATYSFHHQATILREAISQDEKKLQGDAAAIAALKAFDTHVVALQGAEGRGGGGGGAPGGRQRPTFAALNGEFGSLATVVDSADSEPTPAMESAFSNYCRGLATVSAGWNDLLQQELPAVNEKLAAQKLAALPAAAIAAPTSCQSDVASTIAAKQ